jgi:hypothetical protein
MEASTPQATPITTAMASVDIRLPMMTANVTVNAMNAIATTFFIVILSS